MPGSKERWSAKGINEYLERHYPGTIFISRKPTNTEAIVICEKTGNILFRASKNYGVVEQMTNPEVKEKKYYTPLISGIPAKIDIKDKAENLAIQLKSIKNELTELMKGKKVNLLHDPDNMVVGVTCGDILFGSRKKTIKG